MGNRTVKAPAETLEAQIDRLYRGQERTVDDLPYTEEFESIYAGVRKARPSVTRRGLWKTLMAMRKDGSLSRKSKAMIKENPKRRRPVGGLGIWK